MRLDRKKSPPGLYVIKYTGISLIKDPRVKDRSKQNTNLLFPYIIINLDRKLRISKVRRLIQKVNITA